MSTDNMGVRRSLLKARRLAPIALRLLGGALCAFHRVPGRWCALRAAVLLLVEPIVRITLVPITW